MNESTFLCLMYVFLLSAKDVYSKELLRDVKKVIIRVFRDSSCVTDFCLRFMSESLSLPNKEYKLRRNFVKFIRENNTILCDY